MRTTGFFALLMLCCTNILAQGDIPVGTWRSHFSYKKALLIEQAEERVYCAVKEALFYYDLEDQSLNKLSKINGLSDVGISAMHYDNESGMLSIGYENGNIDLLKENQVFNISTIKKSDLTKSKKINQIITHKGIIYLATNFGIIVLDAQAGEIKEAYQNLGVNGAPVEINALSATGSYLYAASNTGILRGSLNNGINLQDFNNWERFEGSAAEGKPMLSITSHDKIVRATDGTNIFQFDGTSWLRVALPTGGSSIHKLRQSRSATLVVFEDKIRQLDTDGNISDLRSAILPSGCRPKDAIFVHNTLWFADHQKGLSRISGQNIERFVPNGPGFDSTSRLKVVEGKMTAFPAFISPWYPPRHNKIGYAQFEYGQWRLTNTFEQSRLDDIVDISKDGRFIASFGDGLLDTQNDTRYNSTNSPLAESPAQDVLISGLAQYSDGSIWIANAGRTSLQRLDKDGNWQSIDLGGGISERPMGVKINSLGQLWLPMSRAFNGGLVVYDPAVGKSRYLSSSNGNLPSAKVTDVEFSKDDETWIATEAGLAVFSSTVGITENLNMEAIKPRFEGRILLEDEFISAIEIDPGNRKWIGTNDGLWLFEDNTKKLLLQFTSENSPLPSNNIIDLKVHPVSGEVFISTDREMVSYRADAAQAKAVHQNVKIFPNPVLPNYTGFVGISGLANDAIIKITTVSGRLVKELHAAGGATSWNVADFRGRRAQTGIYLVFSASADGRETFVGKIAVVN